MIITVKLQQNGYLLNGTMSVPMANGNREYELIKEWLAEGNTPEPEFTEEELQITSIHKQIQEAKAYLASTDYKMTVDYFATLTEAEQVQLTQLRAETREFIRTNEGDK